jgi:hypothetical protein
MNVEIGAEAALFPEKEYTNGIFVAVVSPDALDSAVVTTNFRVEFYSVPLRHVVHKVNGADEAHHALAAASRQHFLGIEGRIYISKFKKI